MRGWFRSLRRKRSQPPAAPDRLSLPDALTASRAGLSEQEWRGLDDSQRREYRWRLGPAS